MVLHQREIGLVMVYKVIVGQGYQKKSDNPFSCVAFSPPHFLQVNLISSVSAGNVSKKVDKEDNWTAVIEFTNSVSSSFVCDAASILSS